MLTVKEAAELVGVHTDTIRNRIKSGEYKAEKREGFYGEQWFLPAAQFDTAAIIKDVAMLTRQVSLGEMQSMLSKSISEAVAGAVEQQTKELKEQYEETTHRLTVQIELLQLQLAMSQEETKKTQQSLSETLSHLEEKSNRSLLSKIFGGR